MLPKIDKNVMHFISVSVLEKTIWSQILYSGYPSLMNLMTLFYILPELTQMVA